MQQEENAQIFKDLQRWQVRKDKCIPKSKHHVHDVLTKHALQRAEQRNMRVKDIVEGRAKIQQILTKDNRYITVIPDIPNARHSKRRHKMQNKINKDFEKHAPSMSQS